MSTILDPDPYKLTVKQGAYFSHYKDLRTLSEASRNVEKGNLQLKQAIQNFFLSLTKEQQYIHKDWYRYEMCNIDPTMIACVEMAEFINKNGLEEQVALSEDGKSFLFIGDDQDSILQIAAKLEQKYQGIKHKIIEVSNG